MKNEGWISIHRKIQDSVIWNSNEPFDKRSAWIDLILMANHKDKESMFDSKIVVIKRGTMITSQRKLAEKWGWHHTTVRKFLETLESANMVKIDTTKFRNKATLISIVKYAEYQGFRDKKGNSVNTESPLTSALNSHRLATEPTQTIMINNENNVNKYNKEPAALPLEEDDDEGMDPMECKKLWEEQQRKLNS